jgi:hypothetical protein
LIFLILASFSERIAAGRMALDEALQEGGHEKEPAF